MTRLDDTQLGTVATRFRGTLAFGGYLARIAALALVAGVVGVSTGRVLDGLYGLAVGVLLGAPVVYWWRQEVTVQQEGFVWRRLTGSRTVLHTEIKSARRIKVSSFLLGNHDEVEVTLLSGQQLQITWIRDAATLALLLSGAEPPPMPGWQPPAATGRGDR